MWGGKKAKVVMKWSERHQWTNRQFYLKRVTIRTVASVQAGKLAVDARPLQVAGSWAAAYTFSVL